MYFHVVLFHVGFCCVVLSLVLLFHDRLCCTVSGCCWCRTVSRHFGLCCVPHTLLVCSDNQQDADRSTASHPEVRRTLSLKKEPLTTYSNKASESDSEGCNHTYSLLCHVHTGLNDTVLICPSVSLKKELVHLILM